MKGGDDLVALKELLKDPKPLKWIFTGDSITHGAKHTHGFRSYPEIFAERIRWEMKRTSDIIINTGISGNTTQNILDDFNWRIGQFKPDVVSLMIGTNDCADTRNIGLDVFENNLNTLVTMIRESEAIPVFQTPNVIIKEKAPERRSISDYVSVMQKVAGEKEVILVDNYTHWQSEIQHKGAKAIFKRWLNDPLHPNGEGHSEIARLMFKEFAIFDPEAPTCGAPYYEGVH
ncbi:MAG: SGNH/GDSL hydrolase family protein [Prolixibacteraceae bacterium]|nr:SGNH/GDSL hydrolase family protein [Prolixibacteraceae bacterium]